MQIWSHAGVYAGEYFGLVTTRPSGPSVWANTNMNGDRFRQQVS